MRDTPKRASDSTSRLPSLLDQIISRCLQKDPADRYPTGAELRDDLEKLRDRVSPEAVARRRRSRFVSGGVAIAALVVIALGAWFYRHSERQRWARTEALPRIEELLNQTSYLERGGSGWAARDLAIQAAQFIDGDPALTAVESSLGREIDIETEPAGAAVYGTAYTTPDGPWRLLGRAPLESIRIPYGSSRIRIELEGYATIEDLCLNFSLAPEDWVYTLHPEGGLPEGMVWVGPGLRDLRLPGIDHLKPRETPEFLIDRHEVTNKQFKRFVDAGGYKDPAYWTEPFVRDGRSVRHENAMERFRDATGQPGPAGWEVGDYPAGAGDHPVSGISWYEAAAYAAFADKSLPTLYHWNQVAETYASGEIIPLSNFGGEGAMPADAGDGLHRFGARNLAGNVREWCQNATTREGRFILGGGWNDPGYAFNDAYAQSPWDRSPTNGFRCIRYLDPADGSLGLGHEIELPFRDFYNEPIPSDEEVAIYLRQFDYDRTPLNTVVEDETDHGDWTRQRVTFDAAYGGERVMAYLFLPKDRPGPYQTVVIFPGSNAIHRESSESITGSWFSFLMKSGRAVIHPIYKGTYERGTALDSDYPEETTFYKEHVIMWAKDLGRSIDFLESREDISTDQLAYMGYSWGGVMGAILPAIEDRISSNVLVVAGLLFQKALPEVDQMTYVSRVTQPTIMINGEFDFFFPIETAQKPLYDLLGASEDNKKYVVFPGSHSIPRPEMIRESLGWLERYQPVD